MANYQYMMSADDVARELNCSKSHAYKLVKSMNEELVLFCTLDDVPLVRLNDGVSA